MPQSINENAFKLFSKESPDDKYSIANIKYGAVDEVEGFLLVNPENNRITFNKMVLKVVIEDDTGYRAEYHRRDPSTSLIEIDVPEPRTSDKLPRRISFVAPNGTTSIIKPLVIRN